MCFYLRNWQVTFLLYTLGVFISEYTAKAFTEPRDYRVVFLIQQGMVRSIDLARHMGFSKPSVSHAVGVLKSGGFLTVDDDGFLHLTAIGLGIAEKIYERHLFFTEQLVFMGVDRNIAEQDACRIEHVISDESFQKLKETLENERGGDSMGN